MAILQALIAFIGRSAGRILNAVFGWAVRALFGVTSAAQQTLLTIVVAMAALWPVLLAGVAWPRVAAFVVAFSPIPKGLSDGAIRAVWAGLSILVPAIVGIALAAKTPPGPLHESRLVRVARGYPTTLGLAIAFWFSFATVPVLRVTSMLQRKRDVYVPLITSEKSYDPVAARVRDVLNARGFALAESEPSFWVRFPLRVLRTLGGRAFRGSLPDRLAYLRGPDLEAALYPSGLLLRGRDERTTLARGFLFEALTGCDVFQTTTPEAQDLESKIQRVWGVLAEHPAHVESRALEARLAEISEEIVLLEASYDDWQIVYREALQLSRALHGDEPLLQRAGGRRIVATSIDKRRNAMPIEHDEGPLSAASVRSAPDRLSTVEVVREITAKTAQLARKEVELARAELREDLRSELGMVKLVGAAAVLGIVMLAMLGLAAVFGLAHWIPSWAGALAVAGVLAVIAGILAVIGWRRHVKKPFARTRRSLEEDVEWAKERMA